jgi:hypothetical protein
MSQAGSGDAVWLAAAAAAQRESGRRPKARPVGAAVGIRSRALAVPRDRARETVAGDVRARKPNNHSAFEASSDRRGCPFGIDVSQRPASNGQLGDRLGELTDRDLDACRG